MWIKRHKELLCVMALGLVIAVALNVMILFYHYDAWTNPKVGFWTAFWTKWEVSGFDPYTYIAVSKWRPLYIISRHPLLAAMVWPLSQLNVWLMDLTGMNCAIFIVAAVMVLLALASWTLMYKLMRDIVELSCAHSLLLTFWFFSFSHVMMVLFVEDHMAVTLPLLLLTLYLAGKAMKRDETMSLWQSLTLLFVSTGVTTTNCVKVFLADFFTRCGRHSVCRMAKHFALYLIPLGIIGALFAYQERTTQVTEKKNIEHTVSKRMERDSAFAVQHKAEEEAIARVKRNQIIHLDFVTNTDYKIDRLPSVVENVFGEGFILHEDYALLDSNKQHRPVCVHYNHWYYYAMEAVIVWLFLMAVWHSRRERLVMAALSMFLFDMLLHVGLNFASADVYIMTAHWAFVIPIAVGYMLKAVAEKPRLSLLLTCTILFLTVFLWVHNLQIITTYILHLG